MGGFGRQVLESTGRAIMALAELADALWKAGGVTIDWSTITAVSADTTLADETVVKNGDKYIRFGTVIGRIAGAEVQTIEFTGGPSSGGATLTLPASGSQLAETASAAIPYNASAQAAQDIINSIARIGPNGATVARSGAGTALSPYVYTVTFSRHLGNVPQFTSANDFGGGTTPSVTHGTTTAGTGTNKYGPIDTTATDGRQTMTRGEVYIVNETVLLSELGSDHPPVFEGGLVFADRLLVNGVTQPTLANLLTAMPGLRLIKNE
jgi:hypothetical protein